jgi:hypothetical protein
MSNREKKLRFVQIGAEALSGISEHRGIYACPICGDGYEQGALATGELTLEHSPPTSMGGRGIALTCTNCNSGAGDSIDVAVRDREDLIDLTRGLTGKESAYRGDAKLTTLGATTNVRLDLHDKHLMIDTPLKQNHPETFRLHQGARPPKAGVPEGDPTEFKIRAR